MDCFEREKSSIQKEEEKKKPQDNNNKKPNTETQQSIWKEKTLS